MTFTEDQLKSVRVELGNDGKYRTGLLVLTEYDVRELLTYRSHGRYITGRIEAEAFVSALTDLECERLLEACARRGRAQMVAQRLESAGYRVLKKRGGA